MYVTVGAQDYLEEDVTRHHFQFDALEEELRRQIEADAFWCMTKVSFYGPGGSPVFCV